MIQTLLPWVADGLVVLGLLTLTIAVYGVVRMPDPLTRLHAAGKPVGLGVIPLLLAAIISGGPATVGQVVLITLFLIVTTPVSAHVIGRGAYLAREQPEPLAAAPGSRPRHSAKTQPSD